MFKLMNIIFIMTLGTLLYGDDLKCSYDNTFFKKELQEYKFRINDFIKDNNITSCNILYAYNHFLSDSLELYAMENNISYMKELGEFIKDYPETGKLINTRTDFEFLNEYNLPSKNAIENAVKETKLSVNNKKENILYLLMALNAQYNNLNENSLKKDLLELKTKYKLKDLKYLMPFWSIYYEMYKEDKTANHARELFDSFKETVEIIGLNTLKKYHVWRYEVYPFFLAEDFDNTKYTKAIVTFLNDSSMENHYKINFIKEIAFDIEQAINHDYDVDEIKKYLNPFMENKQLMAAIFNEACSKNEEKLDTQIISGIMEAKIKFVNEQSMIFNEVIKSLEYKTIDEQIVIISYFNYMTSVYKKLEAVNKQDVLIRLYKELPFDKTSNMRAIMVLGEHSSYFDDLVNDNWKNQDYLYILTGIDRDGYRIIDSFKNQNWSEDDAKQFKSAIHSLIRTPHNKLGDMTPKEIGTVAANVVDKASYATLIIPGVGVVITAAKALAKQSVKAGMKQIAKKGMLQTLKNNSIKTWKFTKQTANEYLDNRIRYGDRRTKAVRNINNSMEKIDGWDFKYVVASTSVGAGIFLYDSFYSNGEVKTICKEN